MGIRRLIYIPNEETWLSIQHLARLKRRSVSNYLVWLHDCHLHSEGLKYSESVPVNRENEEMHRTGDYPPLKEGLIVNIEEPVFVDSEEADRNPEKYPDGAIVTVPEGHENIIKKPVGAPKTVEEVKEKIEKILEDKFFVPYSKDHQTREKKK